ncbi:MAG: methionyl aminopeptidase [Planctomycetota bacterium]|nr:methionyl aminopeptidase [Planctomycetota bacterium]
MPVLDPHDIEGATAAARCVVTVHERLVSFLRLGLTLAQIDDFCAEQLRDLDAPSCFKGYRVRGHPPFPSHACLSVNDCVVHGTHDMSTDGLRDGDLLSIDIGVKHHGWIGDAAWTYAIHSRDRIGEALMSAGRVSLQRGIAALVPGRPLMDFARAVQGHVEREKKLCLIRGLGGHGYGKALHAPPFVSNSVPTTPSEWREAFHPVEIGMLLAVEPMIAVSTTETVGKGNAWPLRTSDGSMSVHYEADVLITQSGPVNLTADLFKLPEIVG